MTEPTGACAPVAAACWGCNIPDRARGIFPAPDLASLTGGIRTRLSRADSPSYCVKILGNGGLTGSRKERFRCG